HHKKGCQVEYSFPPLLEGDPHACPAGWKYLPTLALPDGSHNFDEDTVFFHLPSLSDPKQTVYGISCFRQIPVEKLKNRTADITRGTVQKSVCVLSTLPLYGHIQVKMALITHAYFDEGDFSKVQLLHDTYHHLNSCLAEVDFSQSTTPQLYVGLSVRDLILQFRHKALILFKLLLLERRLVFYRSPVQPLCAAILSLLSLHPAMIERGLGESACVKPSRPMSPIPEFADTSSESMKSCDTSVTKATEKNTETDRNLVESENNGHVEPLPWSSAADSMASGDTDLIHMAAESESGISPGSSQNERPSEISGSPVEEHWLEVSATCEGKLHSSDSAGSLSVIGAGGTEQQSHEHPQLPRDSSVETIGDTNMQSNLAAIAQINADQCGLPLMLFTQGYLCHPYLSLPYLDLLSDINVRGYLVGATNVLFKQKKQLADVLVEVEGARVETQDPELRRHLHLTTEDLRFADYIVRHVAEERHDVFLDGVGWEGGDEWIRTQFRVYLLCLLRTSLLQDGSREAEHFNSSFMAAWRATHNYKMWVSGEHTGIWDLNPGHPFAGQLSVADMKLRLAHTMQNTEGGRKLNQAMVSTGRAVATTGRAVGGALSQARGALSSWWNTLTTVQSPEGEVSGPVPVADEAKTHENEETSNYNNIQDSSLEKLESVDRPTNAKNQDERTVSLRHQRWENWSSQVHSKEPSGKHPANGSIIQPPTNAIIDNNAAPDLLDTFQEKVGSTATQQLPRGIDCNPPSKIPDESNINAAWQVTQSGCSPLKLTGGSSGYDNHTLPQEPAG
ncbi:Late secretory pathway protein AVL9-like protein, partial [Cryptotermes secundus]